MKLVADGERTIIDGWVGLHTGVVILVIIMMLAAALIDPKAGSWFSAGVLFIVAVGYLLERRELLHIFRKCLNIEAPECTVPRSSRETVPN